MKWRKIVSNPAVFFIRSTWCYSFGTSHATNDRAFLSSQFSLVILSVAFLCSWGRLVMASWRQVVMGYLLRSSRPECHRARTTREENLSLVPVLDPLNTLLTLHFRSLVRQSDTAISCSWYALCHKCLQAYQEL